jgi:hypothetical protein
MVWMPAYIAVPYLLSMILMVETGIRMRYSIFSTQSTVQPLYCTQRLNADAMLRIL